MEKSTEEIFLNPSLTDCVEFYQTESLYNYLLCLSNDPDKSQSLVQEQFFFYLHFISPPLQTTSTENYSFSWSLWDVLASPALVTNWISKTPLGRYCNLGGGSNMKINYFYLHSVYWYDADVDNNNPRLKTSIMKCAILIIPPSDSGDSSNYSIDLFIKSLPMSLA